MTKDEFWKKAKVSAVRYSKRIVKEHIGYPDWLLMGRMFKAAYLAGAHMGWNLKGKGNKRILLLEQAIRTHRSKTGHEMCWENDQELWAVLGDNINFNHIRPSRKDFLKRCEEYCDSRQTGCRPESVSEK